MKHLVLLTVMLFATSFLANSAEAAVCTAKMEAAGGRTLDTFFGHARVPRMACREALMKCQRELQWRQSRGRNPFARCVVDRGPRRPGRRLVTQTCAVRRLGMRGRHIQTHVARATGIVGTGVKREACQKAMRQCQRAAVRRQFCRM